MKKFLTTTALCVVAAALMPTPALAFEGAADQALCPMKSIDEAVLSGWTAALGATRGEMDDGQNKVLFDAVRACAKTHGWSDSDETSALEFNFSIIAATAIEEKLLSDGIIVADYEVVLADKSAAELQQILDDSDNSPVMNKLAEIVTSDLGDELTDEIASDIGAYIGFMAYSQLSMMKMVGLVD